MYSEKLKQYLYLGASECCCCQKVLDGGFVIVKYQGKSKLLIFDYCVGCYQSRKKNHKVMMPVYSEEIFYVNSVNSRPKSAIPIIIEPSTFMDGKLTTIEMAFSGDECQIINKTKHSQIPVLSKEDILLLEKKDGTDKQDQG
jgi:hypothetical protein